ncbi:MAG: glycosyltransferase family 2 protein [Alphaproteobacteria bacterium]
MRLSIVVPVYQNARNLPATLPRLLALVPKLAPIDLELVFVDDGSTDGSRALIETAQAAHPRIVTLVAHTRNFGQQAALLTGLGQARGDAVGIVSADLQDPCEIFVEMARFWREGARLVIGERTGRDDGWFTDLLSHVHWRLIARFAVPGFPRMGFDFCLMDRALAEDLVRYGQGHVNLFVTLGWLRPPDVRLPYIRGKREGGRSQWSFLKRVDLALTTFLSFTTLPLRGCLYLGGTVSAASFVYLARIVVLSLSGETVVIGWSSLAALITFFGGLSVLILGILGEYVWQIVAATRKRPHAMVDWVRPAAADNRQAAGRSADCEPRG